MAWHPPGDAPPRQPHGANAFCVTADSEVVLVRPEGSRWGWPGGRPEPGEAWEDTLREMLEEACATVTDARLLGFVQSRCLAGHEKGLVLQPLYKLDMVSGVEIAALDLPMIVDAMWTAASVSS